MTVATLQPSTATTNEPNNNFIETNVSSEVREVDMDRSRATAARIPAGAIANHLHHRAERVVQVEHRLQKGHSTRVVIEPRKGPGIVREIAVGVSAGDFRQLGQTSGN